MSKNEFGLLVAVFGMHPKPYTFKCFVSDVNTCRVPGLSSLAIALIIVVVVAVVVVVAHRLDAIVHSEQIYPFRIHFVRTSYSTR